jgi:hypothetical protein
MRLNNCVFFSYSGPCPTELISMERNFRSLFDKAEAEREDSIYKRGAKLARELIETANDLRVLHGDLHHENILWHPGRGWLAIDPQCLFGERTYDLANAFYNPSGFSDLAANPDRIRRLAKKFSRALRIEEERILQYAFAYGCLSAAWCIDDGQSPDATLKIAREIERLIPEGLPAHFVISKKTTALDSHYISPRLAKLYDLDSGWSIERDFYLSLAGESRKRVLDLGCGTGLICDALAAKGHAVTGVDPAPAMLEVARQKPNGSKIEWIESSAQDSVRCAKSSCHQVAESNSSQSKHLAEQSHDCILRFWQFPSTTQRSARQASIKPILPGAQRAPLAAALPHGRISASQTQTIHLCQTQA